MLSIDYPDEEHGLISMMLSILPVDIGVNPRYRRNCRESTEDQSALLLF